ncbi:Scr1 family TA system antitoxin-like transcriptional regulator [Streptomyces sp. NPDC090046]|uniref:Scr1 family TA system antitoxin-like transcriptional regulator n=1 Tax=Streptomyces sp. NPDC090046 TaxID=3365928 RepID=UPI0037FF6018
MAGVVAAAAYASQDTVRDLDLGRGGVLGDVRGRLRGWVRAQGRLGLARGGVQGDVRLRDRGLLDLGLVAALEEAAVFLYRFESAAGVLNVSRSQLSAIEQGLRAVNTERLRTLASHCGLADEAYIASLTVLAQPPERGWWEAWGTIPAGLLDVSELEWHATRLHTVQTVHLPGLLHQGAYARAVYGSVIPALPASEIELRVAHRVQRQQVLEGDNARPYAGYVHGSALRMQFGGRRATREQLEHLCAVSERDSITLRVLSVAAGAFPGVHTRCATPRARYACSTRCSGTRHMARISLTTSRNSRSTVPISGGWTSTHCPRTPPATSSMRSHATFDEPQMADVT